MKEICIVDDQKLCVAEDGQKLLDEIEALKKKSDARGIQLVKIGLELGYLLTVEDAEKQSLVLVKNKMQALKHLAGNIGVSGGIDFDYTEISKALSQSGKKGDK